MPTNSFRRILLVDDNADVCEMLKMLLELEGHEIQTAHSGTAAIKATRDYSPHVVLLDIGLPDLNGFQVAEQIRKLSLPEQPVLIAVSGYAEDEYRQRSIAAGFDHFLVKPATLKDLQKLL